MPVLCFGYFRHTSRDEVFKPIAEEAARTIQSPSRGGGQAPTLMLQQTEVFDLDPSAIAPKGIDVEKDPGYKA